MNINTDAIDDVALALLYLTLHDRYRAWKGFDWDVLNRLYERGFIEDPVNKTKSVIFTEEGLRESERLFNQHFVIPERPGNRFNELLTHDTRGSTNGEVFLCQADRVRWPRPQLASRDRFHPRKPILEHLNGSRIVRAGRQPKEDFQTPARHDARDAFCVPIDDKAERLLVFRDLWFRHKHFHGRCRDNLEAIGRVAWKAQRVVRSGFHQSTRCFSSVS